MFYLPLVECSASSSVLCSFCVLIIKYYSRRWAEHVCVCVCVSVCVCVCVCVCVFWSCKWLWWSCGARLLTQGLAGLRQGMSMNKEAWCWLADDSPGKGRHIQFSPCVCCFGGRLACAARFQLLRYPPAFPINLYAFGCLDQYSFFKPWVFVCLYVFLIYQFYQRLLLLK